MLKIACHPIYKHHLPDGHRFPMAKYDLLPQQLIYEGTCKKENFFEPEIPNDKYILAVHDAEYYYDLLNIKIDQKAARKIGFPLSEDLIERERIITGGTIKGCEFAIENGVAMNLAGGTHHAYSDHGEAFCMLNDQSIGARYLQAKKLAAQILIVDLDVHQGNGTAEIFQNDTSVFTFSMHGESNYPFRKEASDLDIALKKGTEDKEYLSLLKKTLPALITAVKPDFIFYLSGVDVLASDKLGTLALTLEGCKKRDEFVLKTCLDYKIPVQCSMGGGYSRDIKIIIEAHANTFRLAQELYF
ncbi:Histone deacetylase [Cellulophaga algicola DSM 14237]|uniref:Histone deacetylase n=1 Tax=Cellulophaga algicola (strain DSM 14237 / IC166 / ACAM 630) TaxID=688270 RepID=E6XE85_CELAD|nr:histone deacetylase [Cellulophaga algicola]ADV49166.1 Histone deacetylase [Cellulophaga algicola DSM 14237]